MSLTAVITGSNRGIGYELVKALLTQHNYSTVITAFRNINDADKIKDLKELEVSFPGKLKYVELDISNPESIKSAGTEIKTLTNHINLLINNAGYLYRDDNNVENVEYEALMNSLLINTVGPTLLLKELMPLLLVHPKESKNVFITSLMGSIADNGSGGAYAYRTSKAGINMINKSVSVDYKEKGLVSLAIHPGFVVTGMTKKYWENGVPDYMIQPDFSAKSILDTTFKATIEDTGKFLNYDGEVFPW